MEKQEEAASQSIITEASQESYSLLRGTITTSASTSALLGAHDIVGDPPVLDLNMFTVYFVNA